MSTYRIKLSVLLFCAILLTTGCADLLLPTLSGNVIREARMVDSFTELNICCGMYLEVTQGDETSVELEADENLLPEIETIVRGEQLTVQFRSRITFMPQFRSGRITIYVTMPEVRALELSGGSNGTIEALQTDDLRLDLSGGSRLSIDTLTAEQLTAELSGGAEIRVGDGTVTEQTVNVSGGGEYLLEDVRSDIANLDLSGGSRAEIWVLERLRVDASGGSNLTYRGSPTTEQDISGGSRVRSVED